MPSDQGSQPALNITTHTARSLRTFLLQSLIYPFAPLLTKPGKTLPPGSPQLHPPSSAQKRSTIIERKVEDIYIYDISSKDSLTETDTIQIPQRRRRIYYIAGGSFCQPPSPNHWKFCTELARKIPNAVISLVSPPLAPHCPAAITIPHLVRLYKALMSTQEPEESVTFAGDSSGGNVVLSIVLAALMEKPELRPPSSVMLISPVVDLRFCNPAIPEMERKDPVLRRWVEVKTGKQWAGSWDLSNALLSPLFADLDVLANKEVKVHGVTGGYDILTPDTLLFREKCTEVGIEGKWLHWEKQMHCFPLAFAYGLPESVRGKEWVVDILSEES